jgi:hypothetical protein
MNPDLLADSRTDLRFNAFNEAHANPAEFIGWADGGGNFQRGLFHLAPAKVRSGVDTFESVRHFSCFHNLLFLVASLIHSTTALFYQAHFCWTANLATEALQTLNKTTVAADT